MRSDGMPTPGLNVRAPFIHIEGDPRAARTCWRKVHVEPSGATQHHADTCGPGEREQTPGVHRPRPTPTPHSLM